MDDRRRRFLTQSSFLAIGAGFSLDSLIAQTSQKQHLPLLRELTPSEKEVVNGSSMAKGLVSCFSRYSCAESSLLVALRFLDKPEELVWAAGGFGGGIGHGDLCGFLTGGMMAIGFHAGSLSVERKEAKKLCRKLVKSYWQAWTSMAPLHCSEILERREGDGACTRLGRLASAKLQRLLEPTSKSLVTS
jgi:C_GCAxxG_C_C family probable redox protein